MDSKGDQHDVDKPPTVFQNDSRSSKSYNFDVQCYDLQGFRCPGKYIIFNNKTFSQSLEPIRGTKNDVKAISHTFNKLGFEGEVHEDFEKAQIEEKLKNAFQEDFNSYGCLFIFILTYGDTNGDLYAKDDSYQLESLLGKLIKDAGPGWLGKPKIFMIKGYRKVVHLSYRSILDLSKNYDIEWGESDETNNSSYRPEYADLFIAFAAPPGQGADPYCDFSFIQNVCNTVNCQSQYKDFEAMIVQVKNKHLGMNLNYYPGPCSVSSLTKKLYLNKDSPSKKQERKATGNAIHKQEMEPIKTIPSKNAFCYIF